MPITALDLDTIKRLVVVPKTIEGLQKLNNNIWTGLSKLNNLPQVHEKIKYVASLCIAHPCICSVSWTLLCTASSIILLVELLIDKAPSELDIDMQLLQKLYPHSSCCLATALQEVDCVEFDGGERGYMRTTEDFLSGPWCAFIVTHLILLVSECLQCWAPPSSTWLHTFMPHYLWLIQQIWCPECTVILYKHPFIW